VTLNSPCRKYVSSRGTTSELAEKLHISGQFSGQGFEKFPPRLKPHIEKKPFTARVNSCPDTSCLSSEFFQQALQLCRKSVMERVRLLPLRGRQMIEIQSPQGLKPTPFELSFGTTEVVPCYRSPILSLLPQVPSAVHYPGLIAASVVAVWIFWNRTPHQSVSS
jgi:hypothetical protein